MKIDRQTLKPEWIVFILCTVRSKYILIYQCLYKTLELIDKLYCIYFLLDHISDTGTISPELNSIYQAAFVSFLGGAVYGGFLKSRQAYVDFMENNQASAFKSHFEAKVLLH